MKQTLSPVCIGGTEYETVAAGVTDQVIGGAGAQGDFMARIVLNVVTVLTADVTLKDGATSIVLSTGASAQLGALTVELGMRAKTGPWKITTGAGVTAIAVGHFSP